MASPKTPARGAQAPARPAPTDTPEEFDEDLPGDDAPAPTPEERPIRRDPMADLFAAAKRKLGLPADAEPTELLRAIVGAELAPTGPLRAACKLPVLVDGKRVLLTAGDLIPEGVDPATLPPHAVTRAPKVD